MTDKKTISVYDAQVDSYAELINQLPEDEILLGFIEQLETNSYVLDLGCGPAVSSATMCEYDLRVDPIDASEEMVKLANNTFNIGARIALFEDINTENTYHGIWANFSLLHAAHKDFPVILKALHHSLRPKGLLYLGMKLGNGSKRDKLGRFYSYYSEKELQQYLTEASFKIVYTELGEDSGLAGNMEPWIAITCRAIYKHRLRNT